jgi:hypothetical protein
MIEFIAPLYNWLQQFKKQYLTHCHLLPTGHNCCRSLPSLPAQSLSGSGPMNLATLFYCLRFEASLFITCYELSIIVLFPLYSLGSATAQKTHPLPSSRYMRTTYKTSFATRVLLLRACIETLPRHWSPLLLVAYLLRACLPLRSLAMGLHDTICISVSGIIICGVIANIVFIRL